MQFGLCVLFVGMGVVSPLGHELDEFYNNLLAGKSGISMIEVSSPGRCAQVFRHAHSLIVPAKMRCNGQLYLGQLSLCMSRSSHFVRLIS